MRIFIESGAFGEIDEPLLLNEFEYLGGDLIAQFHDGSGARFPLLPAGALLLPQIRDFGVGQRGDLVLEDLLRRRFRGQDARDLFADDAEDFGEVFDGGAHLLPRLVHHHQTVAEQLFERMVVVEEHRVE